ncbi:MAG: VCBS repeat-containing protein [Anaerolineales bacterium]|nr:VCBS repeat-containing protein [Anaerolineales bacterium]
MNPSSALVLSPVLRPAALPATRRAARAVWGLLAANLLGAALVAALLALLSAARPAQAAAVAPLHARPGAPAAPADTGLTMAKFVTTDSGDNNVVFNGELITYTIVVTNGAGSTATDINILDILPADTLKEVVCLQACEPIFTEQTIPEPLGGTLVITITTNLSWTVASLAPGGVTQLSFRGRVVGQADGTVINNRAIVPTYALNEGFGSASSNTTATTVRLRVDEAGTPGLSGAPTWFSDDVGGTLSQDWGDFNNDGYLDLVLGSSIGTSVYRNEQGRMVLYWSNTLRTYGVRWADFNGDGKLDVVAVGDSLDGSAVTPGTNYLYTQGVDEFVPLGDPAGFPSQYQFVRVVAGNFDQLDNNTIDLIASTNTLNAACPVRLLRNSGAGAFTSPGDCLSTAATAALGAADFDNDGDLDLALGIFPDTIQVLKNDGHGNFNTSLTVATGLGFLPYDFAWGDYDGNGYMDLAAAFPLQKEARIYRNLGGTIFDTPLEPFRTAKFLSPLAVDWGDFSGDGLLDLVVADEVPRVYINNHGTFNANSQIAADALDGQVWSIRGAQLLFGGDLELSLTNRDDSSLLIEGFAPHLDTDLTPVDTAAANSLAWGDVDSDGDLDLVLGAAPSPALGTQIRLNTAGQFPTMQQLSSGPGPQSVALGDVNNDGRLDIAVGTVFDSQLYLAGRTGKEDWTPNAPNFPNRRLAFGDANSDGRLDLLVGANGGGAAVYLNTGSTPILPNSPVFVTPETGDVRAVAWGDFNRDFYLDFVVAFYNQPARLYLNNGNNTFTSVWNSNTTLQTTSVAVADFNGDSYPDLALGHYEGHVQLYANLGSGANGQLSAAPVWEAPNPARTTALAWGDWDYDGYPDLAVGNDFEPNQVYGNFASTPGNTRLFWLWASNNSMATTALAWGDYDGDGDLDLGVSQKGGGANGYYRNGTITPSHLTSDFVPTLARTNNPSYVWVDRPGQTANAYLFSSSELVGGLSQTVAISYTLFDPDGSRKASDLNAPGDTIIRTLFEFSLDGGSTWKTATPAAGWSGPTSNTMRLGQPAAFLWNATKDQAISDDARFRVRIVPQWQVGPAQHASTVAVSPPFRIRALTCVWPENPFILTSPAVISPGVSATYLGGVQAGTGVLTYTWNFGDGALVNGQNTPHTFAANGSYPITLTVTGQACPKNRPVTVNKTIVVGTGLENPKLFLPLLVNGQIVSSTVQDQGGLTDDSASLDATADRATVEATATDSGPASATSTETSTATETATLSPTETAAATDTAPAAASDTPAASETTPPLDNTEVPTNTPATSGLAGVRWAAWRPAVAAAAAQPGLAASGLVAPALSLSAVPQAPISVTQLTTLTTGINNEPAVSGDGTRIIFWSTADPIGLNPDGNIEVFLLTFTPGGLEIKQISNSTGSILGGFNLSPSIDDAGDRMVFFSDRDLIGQNPDSNFEIYLYEAGSDTLYQVTSTSKGFNILPSLSGDGQYLAFASDRDFVGGNADGNTEIFRAQIGAGGVFTFEQVTNSPGGINDQPRINADGSRIAFVSNLNYPVVNAAPLNNADNNREVFLAEISGTVQYVQLSNTTTGSTGEPAINGDGTRVTFVSDRDPAAGVGNPSNLREIYYADISPSYGLSISPVTTSTVEVGNGEPTISADGARIAFVSPGLDQVRIFDALINTELVSDLGASLNPNLSADSTVLVFAHNRQLYYTSSPIAELVVSNVANPSPVFENAPLRYTVVVSNAGPSLAENVRLTETLPTGSYDADQLVFAAEGAACVTGAAPITCTVASLAPNTAVTLTIDLTPTLYGALTNTVDASMTTYERFTNNRVQTPVTVSPVPLASVALSGPVTGTAHVAYTFIAGVTPVSPSLLLTYTWQATGQTPVTQISPAISDSVSFTWNPGGVKTVTVTVSNPAAPVVVATQTITISNPLPTLTAIQPTTATLNSAGFNLVLTGTGFVSTSVARWDGAPLTTTYVTSRTLQAALTSLQLSQIDAHAITVFNPPPAGGPSGAQTFTVNYPAPHITTTAPTGRAAGSPGFTLTLTGSNFIAGAVLHWSGQPDLPTFGSGGVLTASVPAGYVDLAAGVSLSVTNPTPNNGPSNTAGFSISNPTITLTPAGAGILVNNSRVFTVTLSAVQAADRVISLTSSLPAVATVPPTITLPADDTVITFTASGQNVGGTSVLTARLPASLGNGADTSSLTVNYPAPTLSAIGPTTATAGGLTLTLTLTGSDFYSGASVYWGSQAPLAANGSGASLTVTVPAAYLLPAGTVAVTVTNPTPNLGVSGSQTFTLNPLQLTLSPDPVTAAAKTTATVTLTVNALQAATRPVTITYTPAFLLFVASPVNLPANTLQTTFVITGWKGSTGVLTGTLPANLGGDTDSINVTVRNPSPHITTTTPPTTVVGDLSYTLLITGYGFVTDSQVWFDGTQLTQTTYLSDTLLTADVPAGLFPLEGDYGVQVINPPPGSSLSSNIVTITVVNPLPTVTLLSPSTRVTGSGAFTLIVTGTGFINGDSTVLWNGVPRTTTYTTSSQLQAAITAADLSNPGVYPVTVSTAGPGGGVASPALNFTVTTALPAISLITPTTRSVISASFTLSVTGSNFFNPSGVARDSVIQWSDGAVTNTLTTTFLNGSNLTAVVSPALFPTAGVYYVSVFNPDPPGGELSNRVAFTVTNPMPGLSSMSPAFTVSGGLTFTLRVTGSNFITNTSLIYLNGDLLPNNTFLSSASLTATVPFTYLQTPAFLAVTVQTAGPGGGESSPLYFGVDHQPATLTARLPVSATVFSPLTLDVFADNVAPGTQLRWNTTALTPTLTITASEYMADVPLSLFPIGGVYTITMVSPAPPVGGVVSTNGLTLTVYNPAPSPRFAAPVTTIAGTSAVTVTFDTAVGQPSLIPGLQVYLGGELRNTQYISSTQIRVGLLVTDVDTAATLNLTATNPAPNVGAGSFTYTIDPLTISLASAAVTPQTLPATVALTATVGAAQAANRTITLASSNPAIASVPGSVFLPSGNLNAPFNVTGHTSGTVTITATLPAALGGLSATRVITFADAAVTGLAAADNSPKLINTATRFTATVSAGTNISYSWDLGDGSPTTPFTTTNLHTYTYTTGGLYTAIVTARNSTGVYTATTAVEADNPAPTITNITAIAPTSFTTNTINTIAITGTQFVPGAGVRISHTAGGPSTTLSGAAVTYVNSTRLTVTVPAAAVTAAGTYSVFVINPSPPVSEPARRSPAFNIVFT